MYLNIISISMMVHSKAILENGNVWLCFNEDCTFNMTDIAFISGRNRYKWYTKMSCGQQSLSKLLREKKNWG